MNSTDTCPPCGSMNYKQNHRCKDCGRQFVLSAENQLISDAERALVKRLLNEQLSRQGMCRAVRVSLHGRVDVIVGCHAVAPNDLNVRLPEQPNEVIVQCLVVEADDAWSVVRQQTNPQGRWLALEVQSRPVIAFPIGDRRPKSARKRWKKIPTVYRQQATFYTDGHASYQG